MAQSSFTVETNHVYQGNFKKGGSPSVPLMLFECEHRCNLNSQLSRDLHQRLESRHKRANLREATAGYKPCVRHQSTWIIPSLTSWREKYRTMKLNSRKSYHSDLKGTLHIPINRTDLAQYDKEI